MDPDRKKYFKQWVFLAGNVYGRSDGRLWVLDPQGHWQKFAPEDPNWDREVLSMALRGAEWAVLVHARDHFELRRTTDGQKWETMNVAWPYPNLRSSYLELSVTDAGYAIHDPSEKYLIDLRTPKAWSAAAKSKTPAAKKGKAGK